MMERPFAQRFRHHTAQGRASRLVDTASRQGPRRMESCRSYITPCLGSASIGAIQQVLAVIPDMHATRCMRSGPAKRSHFAAENRVMAVLAVVVRRVVAVVGVNLQRTW